MATGYTYPVAVGKMNFEQFVWSCARAMGVCIMLRDEPGDVLPPLEFAPDFYHRDAVQKARIELAVWESMGAADKQLWAKREMEKAKQQEAEAAKGCAAKLQRYRDVLAKVSAWTPPTPEHVNFKRFMVEQLTDSIRHDSASDYYTERAARNVETVIQQHGEDLRQSVTYHAEAWEKEQLNASERTAWVKALNDSIPRPTN